MALKVLMLRKKRDNKNKELENLRKKDSEFEKREKELEEAVNELTEESTDEERSAVQEEVDKFDEEKRAHDESKKNLEKEIKDIEKEIEDVEETQPTEPVAETETKEERGGKKEMNIRNKFFGLDLQERSAFFADETVKNFLGEVRSAIKEKRALSNVGLTIPQHMLPLIKQVATENSKMLKHVNLVQVSGTSRQNVMGDIPEAIWTEMCAELNELDLGFNNVEMDGYMVGGFFAVCNACLEDSDVSLAVEIITALGRAIGKALDKAIIYGHGAKMPLGVVARLAQTTKPTDYPATARPWVKLKDTNVLTGANKTGTELFKDIILKAGCVINDYSSSAITWVMNERTHKKLMAEALASNANGAIVAGMNDTMPILGGKIEELNFIPDNNIVFGHFDMYTLAERGAMTIEKSEHARFLQNQTVFKGTARYDGKPVIAEAFGVLSIDNNAPTTSGTFRADIANDARLASLELGTESLSFSPSKYAYSVNTSGTDAVLVATPEQADAQVTATYGGKTVVNGQKVKYTQGTKDLVVTVTKGLSKLTYTVSIKKS